MAYGRIGSSGCKVRKGKIKLLFRFYLEPGDPRYEEHHVVVPVVPEGGYPGKMVDEHPADQQAFKEWLQGLPTEERDNPFHNHFEYVNDSILQAEVEALMALRLEEFFAAWSHGKPVFDVELQRASVKTNLSDKKRKMKLAALLTETEGLIVHAKDLGIDSDIRKLNG